jgi:hypothetical protein
VVRQIGKRLTATATSTATALAQRVFLRSLTATVTTTATLARRTGKLVAATVTTTGTATKRIARALTASVTALASIVTESGQPTGHIDGIGHTQRLDDGMVLLTTVDGTATVTHFDEGVTAMTGAID